MEEILLYFSLKYEGDFDEIYQALQQKEKVSSAVPAPQCPPRKRKSV